MEFTDVTIISIFTDPGFEEIAVFSDMNWMSFWIDSYSLANPDALIADVPARGAIIDSCNETAEVFMYAPRPDEDDPVWLNMGVFTDITMADIFEDSLPSSTTYRRLTLPLNPSIET